MKSNRGRGRGNRQQYRQKKVTFTDQNDIIPRIEAVEASLQIENNSKKQFIDMEKRLQTLEDNVRNQKSEYLKCIEDLKKRIDLLEKNNRQVPCKCNVFEQMDHKELKILGDVFGKLKDVIEDSKKLKEKSQDVECEEKSSVKSPQSVVENISPNVTESSKKRKRNSQDVESEDESSIRMSFHEPVVENILSHCNYIMDDDNRAIVCVKSKIIETNKNTKAAFGVWWATGHEANKSCVIEGNKISHNSVNLQAIICALETAISYKVRRVCLASDAEYVINMITEYPDSVETEQPDERDLFCYVFEMIIHRFDNVKWLYAEILSAAFTMGIDSVMITSLNFAPSLVRSIHEHIQRGRNNEALKIERKLMMLTGFVLNMSSWTAGYKAVTSIITGINLGNPRSPLKPLSEMQLEKLKNELKDKSWLQ